MSNNSQFEVVNKERMELITERLEEMNSLLINMRTAMDSHKKDGVCYNTTKLLLEAYRSIKYDEAISKALQTVDLFEAYGQIEKDSADDSWEVIVSNLDYIMTLPDNLSFCSNAIKKFMSSSEPATLGKFYHLITSGLKIMNESEDEKVKKECALLLATYVNGTKAPAVKDIVDELNISNQRAYFRKKERAISTLSLILFGPFGERHPQIVFEYNDKPKEKR